MQQIFLSKMGTWQYQRRVEQLRMHNKVELYKEKKERQRKHEVYKIYQGLSLILQTFTELMFQIPF